MLSSPKMAMIDKLAGFHFQVTVIILVFCSYGLCVLKIFCLNLKWHCLHFKIISTCLWGLWSFRFFAVIGLLSEMTLFTFYNSFDLPVAFLEYFVVMSYLWVLFLPGSKMTLFAFYNYFDLPLKPLASFLNLLLLVLMCFLNFVFSLYLKWHCLHLTNISTLILDLWSHF